MKIGQRLALRFTLVSAVLTGAVLILIYIITRGFVHSDFIERLTQQSRLEILHYASPHVKEVIPPGSFLLVDPITSIYSQSGDLLHQDGNYEIPSAWVSYLQGNNELNRERGPFTTVGRKHSINNKVYLVFISDKDLPAQHELDILRKAILIGWGSSLILAYLAGLYVSSKALQPVKHVVNEVKQITKDNLNYRLTGERNFKDPDEIDELVITFNALLERIGSAFVVQKRFVQHASHELKTPLTSIMGEAELALVKDRGTEEYKRTLQVIVNQAERLINITQGLLTLARLEEGYFTAHEELVNLTSLSKNALDSMKLRYPNRAFVFHSNDGEFSVMGNKELLSIALQNLLENSVKYSEREILVTVSKMNDKTSVRIKDFGIGIPENDIQKIKLPMFRAGNVRNIEGAGLGLSLVETIIKIHKGDFEIISEEGVGTTCIITLKS